MILYIRSILTNRLFMWGLFWINLLGTVYGYIWYWGQMQESPWYFLPWVPDSPTSSLFFTIVLFLWLIGRSSPFFEMMSLVCNVKYGIWAVWVLAMYGIDDGGIVPANLMLMFSHGGMAIEVILYAFMYQWSIKYLWIAALWLFSNDFIDYVYDMHPYLEDHRFIGTVSVGTVCLSIFSLGLAAWLHYRNRYHNHSTAL